MCIKQETNVKVLKVISLKKYITYPLVWYGFSSQQAFMNPPSQEGDMGYLVIKILAG